MFKTSLCLDLDCIVCIRLCQVHGHFSNGSVCPSEVEAHPQNINLMTSMHGDGGRHTRGHEKTLRHRTTMSMSDTRQMGLNERFTHKINTHLFTERGCS